MVSVIVDDREFDELDRAVPGRTLQMLALPDEDGKTTIRRQTGHQNFGILRGAGYHMQQSLQYASNSFWAEQLHR